MIFRGISSSRKERMKKWTMVILSILLLSTGVLKGTIGCKNKKSEEQKAEIIFQEGKELLKEKRFDDALKKFESGLEKNPDSASGYNLLGLAYRGKFKQTRDPKWQEKEREAFLKAIELVPSFWKAMINLGFTYYQEGKKKEAVHLFQKAIELNPLHPERKKLEQIIREEEPRLMKKDEGPIMPEY